MSRHRRKLPSMKDICAFHHVPHGRCLRCRQPARCEKAHIIDRAVGGLDVVCNLVPLCYPCHHAQPMFAPGEEVRALAWFSMPDEWDYLIWLSQRCFTEAGPELRARILNPETQADALPEALVSAGLYTEPIPS